MRGVYAKINAIRAMLAEAEPGMPLVLDSLRLQSRAYSATHGSTGLTFELRPKCGDWFTFYEVLIRQDYLASGRRLRPGDKVLDIGGNFGAFALLAGKLVGPEGEVHCYEPVPESIERIRGHVLLNSLPKVSLFQEAVGGDAGTISFYLSEKSALNSSQPMIDGRTMAAGKRVEVKQVSITEVMSRIDGELAFAKIDCEGAEYEIMDRMTDAELARIRTLVMETHSVPGRSRERIIEKLRDNSFDIREGNPFTAINRALS